MKTIGRVDGGNDCGALPERIPAFGAWNSLAAKQTGRHGFIRELWAPIYRMYGINRISSHSVPSPVVLSRYLFKACGGSEPFSTASARSLELLQSARRNCR